MKRKIIEIVTGRGIDLSKELDLNRIDIRKLWTVYDEKRIWGYSKFNTQTGEPVKCLEDLTIRHHEGVFLEDRIHDWNIRNGRLDYFSRVVGTGEKIKILIEYEDIKVGE